MQERTHLRENGWKYARVSASDWEDAVALAHMYHAGRQLFQKCQTKVVPELPPDAAEAEVPEHPLPAHVNPGLEQDNGSSEDEESDNEVILLVENASNGEDMEQDDGPEAIASASASSSGDHEVGQAHAESAPETKKNSDLTKLERLMVLKLIYGRGPGKK